MYGIVAEDNAVLPVLFETGVTLFVSGWKLGFNCTPGSGVPVSESTTCSCVEVLLYPEPGFTTVMLSK